MTRDRFLTDAEVARLMAAVRTRRHVHRVRDHAYLALLANTGIRPGEALALTRADLFLSARRGPWMYVHRTKRRHAADPITHLPLNPRVAAVVGLYAKTLRPEQRLFPFTKRQSARLFKFYAARAGLAPYFRVFSLRHTFGMRAWRFTEDARLIQGIMGHVHLRPAFNYAHVSPERIRRMHETLGSIY